MTLHLCNVSLHCIKKRRMNASQGHYFVVLVYKAMACFAFGDKLAGFFIGNLVCKRVAHVCHRGEKSFDYECVAEARHGFILAGGGENGGDVALVFNCRIVKHGLREIVQAGFFKIAYIVGVVNDVHSVRFVVIDFSSVRKGIVFHFTCTFQFNLVHFVNYYISFERKNLHIREIFFKIIILFKISLFFVKIIERI